MACHGSAPGPSGPRLPLSLALALMLDLLLPWGFLQSTVPMEWEGAQSATLLWQSALNPPRWMRIFVVYIFFIAKGA